MRVKLCVEHKECQARKDKIASDKIESKTVDAEKTIIRQSVTILNKRGLHARASAKFVKLTECFEAEVLVERNDMSVSGRSIMGLMMLAAAPGTELVLSSSGPMAEEAMEALVTLIANKFDED